MRRIAAIVEGHGEVEAFPVLLRRLGERIVPGEYVEVPTPIRVKRDRVIRDDAELGRAVELAARKAGNEGAVLLLLDADEECPARLAPELLDRVRARAGDTPCAVVLARREYEAWFLAAAGSIAGQRGLRADIEAPPDPEAVGGAKSWLTERMPGSRAYRETRDQPALSMLFDLDVGRAHSPSFDKLWREVERLLAGADARGAGR